MKHRVFCLGVALLFAIPVVSYPASAAGQNEQQSEKSVSAAAPTEDAGVTPTNHVVVPESHADTVVGYPLSDNFRRAVVRVPDEIEELRTAMKDRLAVRGVRFDEIDTQLEQSRHYIGSQADRNVYYALFHANHLLAMSFYRWLANAPEDEIAQGQLESVTCTLESKFALLKGVLYAGIQDCSILSQRSQGDGLPEEAEAAKASNEPAHSSYPLQPLIVEPRHSPNTLQTLSCELVKSGPAPSNSGQVPAQSTASAGSRPSGVMSSIGAMVRHSFQILGGASASDQSSH
jgi:hypothetical protein